jgi:hypothetical protein
MGWAWSLSICRSKVKHTEWWNKNGSRLWCVILFTLSHYITHRILSILGQSSAILDGEPAHTSRTWTTHGTGMIQQFCCPKVWCTGQMNTKIVSGLQSVILFTYSHYIAQMDTDGTKTILMDWGVKGQVYCSLIFGKWFLHLISMFSFSLKITMMKIGSGILVSIAQLYSCYI